ncbi:hypothetical protein PTNB85_10510 [Pyrenophora teres f. teres]|nr:hypothetical protein PTNB85_10510 [Pyrenophora teres f. teres]
MASPSSLTSALLMRDGSCRLSGCREQLQVAHIVPQSELGWWKENDMSRYNTGSTATLDDAANALLLRADLHIVPKPTTDPTTDGSMRLVAHLLEYSPELEHLYHNRELYPTAVGMDMLYARFAWSVFTLLDAFLESGARGFVTAANCKLFSSTAARRRSQSPKKRKPDRDTITEAQERAVPPTGTSLKRKSIAEAEIQLLAQTLLELERQRSDPDGKWNKEQNWVQCVWDGETLTSRDVAQWLEAVGVDIRDV